MKNQKEEEEEDARIAREYIKIKMRIYRHGENICKQTGRKKKSTSHKKRVKQAYIAKKRQEKIDNGWIPKKGIGRPKKNKE